MCYYECVMATKKTTKRTTTPKLLKAITTQTSRDLRDALLIVSLTANLFMVSLWVALQVTARYDDALIAFFIHR